MDPTFVMFAASNGLLFLALVTMVILSKEDSQGWLPPLAAGLGIAVGTALGLAPFIDQGVPWSLCIASSVYTVSVALTFVGFWRLAQYVRRFK